MKILFFLFLTIAICFSGTVQCWSQLGGKSVLESQFDRLIDQANDAVARAKEREEKEYKQKLLQQQEEQIRLQRQILQELQQKDKKSAPSEQSEKKGNLPSESATSTPKPNNNLFNRSNVRKGIAIYKKTFTSNGAPAVVSLLNKLSNEFDKKPNFTLLGKIVAIDFCGTVQTTGLAQALGIPNSRLSEYFATTDKFIIRNSEKLIKLGYSKEECGNILKEMTNIVLEELKAQKLGED